MSKDPNEEYNKSYAQTRQQNHIHGSNEKVGWSSGSSGSSGGVSGCFPRGTQISTPSGNRDVSTLHAGDHVITIDPSTQAPKTAKILKSLCHRNNKMWLMQFADGSSLRTTGIHSFLVNGHWQRAKQIQAGDMLTYLASSGILTAKRVERSDAIPERGDVYNLIVEGEFHFLANGMLAHSFAYFRTTRALTWTFFNWFKTQTSPILQGTNKHLEVTI